MLGSSCVLMHKDVKVVALEMDEDTGGCPKTERSMIFSICLWGPSTTGS